MLVTIGMLDCVPACLKGRLGVLFHRLLRENLKKIQKMIIVFQQTII